MKIGHEIISTVILSLPLIQVGQLSVTGERMCTDGSPYVPQMPGYFKTHIIITLTVSLSLKQFHSVILCLFGPCHEIMALFILRKLILQTPMRSHPVGLDVLIFWSDRSSTSILHARKQRRLWQDCTHAQTCLSLRWLPM